MNTVEERLHAYMVSALAGDNVAYRTLLKELSVHLRAFFRKRLHYLSDDVEDLVQEVLLAIHNQRHTYQVAQPITAWAYAIARYKLIDFLRRRSAHDVHNEALDDVAELTAVSDEDAGNAKRDIQSLLAQLPQHYRLPIEHVKLEGMSIIETAAITGMSESAVKIGIHRGMKKLSAMIRGDV